MKVLRRFPRRFGPVPCLVAAVAVFVAACAPAPASPTAAPAKPTEAPKPAASPAAASPAPAASPGASPAASPSPAAKPAAQAISLPKPELTSLKLGHSTVETSQLSYAFAKDLGLYQRYGLESVELFYNETDAKSVQALISGGVDLTAQGVSSAISSQTTDDPLVCVAMTSTILTDTLVGASSVKSAADLRGKPVAISTFGSTAHGSVLLALKALGLTADDVTIVQIGGQAARIAALKAGSVAGAPVDVAMEEEMKQQGFNILTRPDPRFEYGRNGMLVRREWLQKYPNTVLAMVAAVLEAQQLLYTQTDKAIDSFAKWAQFQDRARAEGEVREFLNYARRDMRWSKVAFELTRDVISSANPAVKDVDVTKAYTFEFLDRLQAMGFNDAVGVPK